MEPSELLRRFAEACERLGLPYFITGSMATVLYGEPRLTNDIDAVVAVPLSRATDLAQAFPADEYYVSEDAARDAAARAAAGEPAQFNIIHPASGLKIDVMVPPDTAFNRSRFARARRQAVAEGATVVFAAPEDVILKKFEYYSEGGSEKHLRDIEGVLKVSRDDIDIAYIDHWAADLGVAELWKRIRP